MSRSGSRKTFGAGVHAGWKVMGWPFGRLAIGDDDLTVYSWPFPWIRPRSASRQAIGDISFYRRWPVDYLEFAHSAGALSGVRLALPVRSRRIVAELRTRGYPVTGRQKARGAIPGPPR